MNDEIRSSARRHLGKHFTRATAWRNPELLVVERSKGCYLWDDHGNRYLDGLSGLFCVNIGHGRRDLAEVAARQMEKLSYATNWSAAHPPSVEAAALIAELAPGDLGVVFFVNSGSEANESAIKFAREYHQGQGQPERVKIIGRHMAYHGTTLGALTLTGIPQFRAPFMPLLSWFRHVPNTYGYEKEGDVPVTELTCVRAIEAMILAEGPETVAMIVAEPVQNVGGILIPPDGYWQELRRLCDQYGILLCADEVICGFGRLGHWFGSERNQVVPGHHDVRQGGHLRVRPVGRHGRPRAARRPPARLRGRDLHPRRHVGRASDVHGGRRRQHHGPARRAHPRQRPAASPRTSAPGSTRSPAATRSSRRCAVRATSSAWS